MSHEIFQDLILQLHKHPKNELKDVPADQLFKKNTNPLCGDEVTIIAQPEDIGHGQTGQLHFIGEGCAISRASAALAVDDLSNKSTVDALGAIDDFLNQLDTPYEESNDITDEISNRNALLSIRRFPARSECAALAWKTARQLLTDN